MGDYTRARSTMVESQLRTNDVTDRRVLAAMLDTPRELFVPERLRPFAYIDEDLLLGRPRPGQPGRFLMEPRVFAKLLQLAEIGPASRVLDVGCGTGYSTAVISKLAGSVVGLESEPALLEEARRVLPELGIANATLVEGALEAGHPAEPGYDVIMLEGAVEIVPKALLDQLAPGGRLVAVVGQGRAARATLHSRTESGVASRPDFDCAVPLLPGFAKPATFVF